ncbi:hypothetical protein EU805_04080 [Salipiger sp. IMCC34102]|uniref:hypothetical protein n=1 Tax=Salipiger sp. IMCC34102 TaxID=2510647 RepID=UPI00101D6456|nr:hypothetical protein [Salipiger sp. IMCC34102]RYH04543.1 hypothetical protein EU805_04080 [Salipiger sp. IMCC34102]
MQLLTTIEVSDFDSFKSGFDAEAEKRMQAGLTLLQMWRDTNAARSVMCLFDVNDRDKAEAWLETEAQTGTQITGRFLRTA